MSLRTDVSVLYVDPRGTLARRFWAKIEKNGPVVRHELGSCWQWMASVARKGYGQIMCAHPTGKRPQRAHRVSWFIHHGALPTLCVLHRCDNRRCVRPDHLFVGTIADNNADMRDKGRAARLTPTPDGARLALERLPRGDRHYARTNPERLARGESHGNSRLTAGQVASLRAEREAGAKLRDLAAKYGIAECSVSAIARGRNWKDAP